MNFWIGGSFIELRTFHHNVLIIIPQLPDFDLSLILARLSAGVFSRNHFKGSIFNFKTFFPFF